MVRLAEELQNALRFTGGQEVPVLVRVQIGQSPKVELIVPKCGGGIGERRADIGHAQVLQVD